MKALEKNLPLVILVFNILFNHLLKFSPVLCWDTPSSETRSDFSLPHYLPLGLRGWDTL